MHFRQIYPLIAIFLFNALCHGEEFIISVSSLSSPHSTPTNWRHYATNSAVEIKGIEVDVFQWRAAADSRKSVQVDILNGNWEFSGWIDKSLNLPEVVEISTVSNFRGTPTVYIRVTPWRIINGMIEVLVQGEIQISVEPVEFPITYSHLYLLNGDKRSLKRGYSENTQFLIVCPILFKDAAESLKQMHMYDVDENHRLETEILLIEDISSNITGYEIRDTIINLINNDLENDLEFLLLFGDENDIPPIFEGDYPSDDFYSTVHMYSGDPQLFSGRIPARTANDAWAVVEKIKQYTLHPTPGIWRSKVALVADDMYRSCSLDDLESNHTANSDSIYNALHELISILPFYGVHYGLQSAGSGCEHPNLTKDLIRTINNGVALINYIGHGDHETWAGEKIITKSRDLPLIHVDKGKLAIWVAGTCSFGKYNGKNSFMEELLIKEDGAIALVATTDEIGYTPNSNFLYNLFGLNGTLGIQHIIKNGYNIRLGELVLNAKNGNYKFHVFGDPALRLPFPSRSEDIFDPPDEIPFIEEGNLAVNGASSNSTLLIKGNDKDITYDYGSDSLIYTVPGPTYTQVDFTSSTCFRIPIDADACDNCAVIQVYQDENGLNGKIQTNKDISIISSDAAFQDKEGPEIKIFQKNNLISAGSALLTNTDLTVSLIDTSGINLMETIGHGIRYAYDDDGLTLLPGSEFSYEGCDSGSISIPVPPTLSEGLHRFYLEAWDGVNNKSTVDISLEILGNSSNSPHFLYNVYPLPNPFSESTEFTMFVADPPASIAITVYSLIGEKVIELAEYQAEESFISIQWNGKDQTERKIANGAYFYHVKAEKDGNIMFEDIFKLAKVE